MSRNKNIQKFIDHVYKSTAKKKVQVDLVDAKYLILPEEGYARVNGYFDEAGMVLKCAVGKSYRKWVPILVHEYAHFLQWRSKCAAWVNCVDENGEDHTDKIFLWAKHRINLSSEKIERYIGQLRNLELDCERRAVKILRKFDLPLSETDYIQRAAAYVHLYNYMALRRCWYKTGHPPYEIKEIVKEMPTSLRGQFKSIPKKYLDLYDKYLPPPSTKYSNN